MSSLAKYDARQLTGWSFADTSPKEGLLKVRLAALLPRHGRLEIVFQVLGDCPIDVKVLPGDLVARRVL